MTQAKIPPGPRGHLLLGCLPDYAGDTLGFMTRLARQYGDAVRFRLGRMSCYLFSHPDQIEEVLRSKSQHFIKDRPLQISTSVFGRSLLTSEGDLWRRQRRLIQPAFLAQEVRGYGPVMVEAAGRMLATWRDGQVRDIHADLVRVTFDVVARWSSEPTSPSGPRGSRRPLGSSATISSTRSSGPRSCDGSRPPRTCGSAGRSGCWTGSSTTSSARVGGRA